MDPKALLPEFDQEIEATRRVLERVPDDRLDFRPHEKSWTIAGLAGHVAQIPFWATVTMGQDELDLDRTPNAPVPESTEEILARLEETAAGARAAIEGATAAGMASPWTLRSGDTVHFTMPRMAVYRSMVMNHLVHHRGQLTVYLRLLDMPVPGVYGPSADEA